LKRYIYFVSYLNIKNNMWGMGRVEIGNEKRITSIQDIADMESFIKTSTGSTELTITNYQFMRVDKNEPEGQL